MVTLDTMRADRLGRVRNGIALTPNLSRLAEEGRVFTRAVAAGIPTYFGFPPMFRGGMALDHGKVIGLTPGTTSFVEELSRAGYSTGAVIASNPYLSHYYRYDVGFDHFDSFHARNAAGRGRRGERRSLRLVRRLAGEGAAVRLKRAKAKLNYIRECVRGANPALHEGSRGEVVTARGLEFARRMDGDRPFFLWLHYMDVHGYFYATQADRRAVMGASTPFADALIRWRRFCYVDRWTGQIVRSQEEGPDQPVAHTALDETVLTGFYDAAVRYVDRSLSPLLDWVRNNGRTAVFVTADHGEQFYDHGKIGHAPISAYDEVARVPLIAFGPGIERGSVGEWVSHSSVPVSITELAGLASRVGDAPSLLSGTPRTKPVFTETLYGVRAPFPRRRFDEHALLIACRAGRYKYVWREEDGAEELFDLDADPSEKVSLIGEPETAAVEGELRASVRKRAADIAVSDARAKLAESARRLGRSVGIRRSAR